MPYSHSNTTLRQITIYAIDNQNIGKNLELALDLISLKGKNISNAPGTHVDEKKYKKQLEALSGKIDVKTRDVIFELIERGNCTK